MNFLVIGLARSGVSACNFLADRGETVFAFDDNKKIGKELMTSNILKPKVQVLKKLDRKSLLQTNTIVISPGVPAERFESIARKYKQNLISELELAFQNCGCPVLAITGTNGKTTTTTLLGEIMKSSGRNTFVVGNVGTAFTSQVANMKKDSVAVCEVSSFQLEKITSFKPKIAGFLNLAPDHLDRYKRFENYISAKANIFRFMDKKDVAVLNYDDLLVRDFYNKVKCECLFFSLDELPKNVSGAFLKGDEICWTQKGKIKEKISVKDIKLKGRHNIYNILCAVIMAREYGVSPEDIQKAINNFNGLPHRLEFVKKIGGVEFYDDSKGTNIHSTVTALKAFDRPIVLLAGGSDKGENFARLFENMPRNVIKIITFGACGKKIFVHGMNAGFYNIIRTDKLEDAFDEAVSHVCGDEIILLSPACASFDEFKKYEERGDFFKYLVNGLVN